MCDLTQREISRAKTTQQRQQTVSVRGSEHGSSVSSFDHTAVIPRTYVRAIKVKSSGVGICKSSREMEAETGAFLGPLGPASIA